MSNDPRDFINTPAGKAVKGHFQYANDLLAETGDTPPNPHTTIEQVLEEMFNQALEQHGADTLPHEVCEQLRGYIAALSADLDIAMNIEVHPSKAVIKGTLEESEEDVKELVFEFAALFHKLSLSQIIQLAGTQAGEKLKKMVEIGESLEATKERKDDKHTSRLKDRTKDDGEGKKR